MPRSDSAAGRFNDGRPAANRPPERRAAVMTLHDHTSPTFGSIKRVRSREAGESKPSRGDVIKSL